jgi:hypothetical protein
MNRVQDFRFSSLQNSSASQLYRDMVEIISTVSDLDLSAKLDPFVKATGEFIFHMKPPIKFEQTKELKEKERIRDMYTTSFISCVRVGLVSADADEAASAAKVMFFVDKYNSKKKPLAHRPQNQQTEDIILLHNDLSDTEVKAHLKKVVGAEQAFDRLIAINNDFRAIYNERDVERESREQGQSAKLRKAADKAAVAAMYSLNAYVEFHEDDPSSNAAVAAINSKIDQAIINRRNLNKGSKKGDANDPDDDKNPEDGNGDGGPIEI